MNPVRLGIIGIGNMGRGHIKNIEGGKCPGIELTAICDREDKALEGFERYQRFDDAGKLLKSGLVDAVMIATPHYDHTTLGIATLKAGLHLMVEKPISVHVADCQRLIAAWEAIPKGKRPVFAAMFNQRTDPRYRKVRDLIRSGEIGDLRRINWIITDWFRTDAYYASGGWRATWAGEGGGVLLNQCPHQLDLLWWLFGAPKRITANCRFGQWHDIEVEDDVSALLEYENGASGIFCTTTGEAPGTNRLEIVGTRGKLVAEGQSLVFHRNRVPMDEHCRTTTKGFDRPECWRCEIPFGEGYGGQHAEILQNFAEVVRGKGDLLAPAQEGIHSVGLANAMLYSAFTSKAVDLPIDAAAYERKLKALCKTSRYAEKAAAMKSSKRAAGDDFATSFSK